VSTFAASSVPLSAGYAAPLLDLPHAVQSHEGTLNEEMKTRICKA
jgi:hypothetical protein